MLAHTSDNLVRAAFSLKKVFIVQDLRLYYESDTLFERPTSKTSIRAQRADFVPENPLENTFSRKLSNEPILRIYEKKSSTFPSVVWAEESQNGLRFAIRPSYDGVPTTSIWLTDGQSSCRCRGKIRSNFVERDKIFIIKLLNLTRIIAEIFTHLDNF